MARQKILIVDDEEGLREMLRDLLCDMDCELLFAENGQRAFEMAKEHLPDCMLLDIMMPEMDGYEVCRRLRSSAELSGIPVIMLTGHNIEESARKGIDVGAEDVLGKPFNMSELKLRVKTVLQLNRFRHLAGERALFEWVVEHSESGYVMMDNKNIVTYMNPQARLYLNVQDYSFPQEQKTFFEIAQKHFEQIPENIWEQWPEIGKEQVFLVRPETRDSKALWLKVEKVEQEMAAASTSVVVRLRDVTSDMLMFQSMWQFEHMVSHKLRTPLMALIGSLDLLEGRASELGSDENARLVVESSEAAQKLNTAIKGVLQHLSSRKAEPVSEACVIEKFENYTNLLPSTLGFDNVYTRVEPELMLRALQLSNEDSILILQEILGNSQKFHPNGNPTVHVNILAAGENAVEITITDDGRNVNQETLRMMGTPFFQAEKHFTGEIPGMGLGLSMVSTMLASIGGRCRVSNREDRPGLCVRLEVPLVPEDD